MVDRGTPYALVLVASLHYQECNTHILPHSVILLRIYQEYNTHILPHSVILLRISNSHEKNKFGTGPAVIAISTEMPSIEMERSVATSSHCHRSHQHGYRLMTAATTPQAAATAYHDQFEGSLVGLAIIAHFHYLLWHLLKAL